MRTGYGVCEQWTGGAGIAAPPVAVVVAQPQCTAALTQQAIPQLGVASVKLLPDVVLQQGVVYFTVEVCPDNGAASWQVLRRYNQFNALATRLGSRSRRLLLAKFPKKHLTGCKGRKLEKRRRGLEAWLSQVNIWSQSDVYAGWRVDLRTFLYADAVSLPVAATASAPLADPTETAPTTMHLPLSTEAPSASSGVEMEVEVPPGVRAGQFIGIQVPSGEQPLLQIPEGVLSGQTLRLWYEAGSITLI
jgi:hypothetical protein